MFWFKIDLLSPNFKLKLQISGNILFISRTGQRGVNYLKCLWFTLCTLLKTLDTLEVCLVFITITLL